MGRGLRQERRRRRTSRSSLAGPSTPPVHVRRHDPPDALTPLGLAGGYTPADDALVATPVRDPGADQQFYFVMTDRFANGDTSNDTGGLTGDRLTTGFDPTDKGFYEGGDLAGLHSKLDYIQGLGTTAIWLTPSFKNKPVQGTGADASAGYHGYWITDFTQIDPHLGTNAELEALIADAHARGIKVYFDIITNHTADVIEYAQQTSTTTSTRRPARTRTRPATRSTRTRTPARTRFPTMDPATSFPYTPVIKPEDANVKVPDWLNDPTLYHNRGDSTYAGESTTYGDFSGLDDLMTENPTVVNGFVDVYDQLGRPRRRRLPHRHRQARQLRVLAEVHDGGPGARDLRRQPGLLHVRRGLRRRPGQALAVPARQRHERGPRLHVPVGGVELRQGRRRRPGLHALYAGDDMYTTPTTNAQALPTFLGNHDMGRIGYFVKDGEQPRAALRARARR